jgi:hypothetical protein
MNQRICIASNSLKRAGPGPGSGDGKFHATEKHQCINVFGTRGVGRCWRNRNSFSIVAANAAATNFESSRKRTLLQMQQVGEMCCRENSFRFPAEERN